MGSQQDKKITPTCAVSSVSCKIVIKGVVQGVGFRPFIYRLAREHGLEGYVLNSVAGVIIEIEGRDSAVDQFIRDIPAQKPPAAAIDSLQVVHRLPLRNSRYSSFTIRSSAQSGIRTVLVPPDMDICHDCLRELLDPRDRRFLYPFINCTNCGPRYTIIADLPYDRPATSMGSFPLCPACHREYHDPDDRRFHAQPNACPACGPQLRLLDRQGDPVTGDPLANTRKLLSAGKIMAIKGIGGFHLAVNASDAAAVQRLRHLKKRPDKPLALMADRLETIKTFARITAHEEALLTGMEKPIVLLRKNQEFPLPAAIAPATDYIGVMLPYSPLHHLLFHQADYAVLVLTSGNLSDEPIVIDSDTARQKLGAIADYILDHNRPILTSNDDSVIKSAGGRPLFLRRSRSYAPLPAQLPFDAGQTLALGGNMKNVICFTKGTDYFLSQHNGDLQHYEAVRHFETVIEHLGRLLQIRPDLVVHDLHPDYYSTTYAKQLSLPMVAIQHHHAHAVSCMAENRLHEPVLAVTLDGSGYGEDGTIWGGELLIAEHAAYSRAAHLKCFHLPGGDQAARQPWRSAAACLYQTVGENILAQDLPFVARYRQQLPTIISMIDQQLNTPKTSSCGRLFDCVAALAGVRQTSTYEGQAATELEMLIKDNDLYSYPFTIEEPADSPMQLDWEPMLAEILTDIKKGVSPAAISNCFHNTLVRMFAAACAIMRERNGINQVVLSGGVFQNSTMCRRLRQTLTDKGFQVFTQQLVPPNDGGLCLGQALAGRAKYKKSKSLRQEK